jgi:hypothetical protein
MSCHYRSMAVLWSELLSGFRNLVADIPIVVKTTPAIAPCSSEILCDSFNPYVSAYYWRTALHARMVNGGARAKTHSPRVAVLTATARHDHVRAGGMKR